MTIYDEKPHVVCLTLPRERERQRSAKEQITNAGFSSYEFFPGFPPEHEKVRQAYDSGRVLRFPPCFRCGKLDCGRDCNNILIAPQIAVVLSYQAMFRRLAAQEHQIYLCCEDDVQFVPSIAAFLSSDPILGLVREALANPRKPFLLKLAAPEMPDGLSGKAEPDVAEIEIREVVRMSNVAFLINSEMAAIAAQRLEEIDATADQILHSQLARSYSNYTVVPNLAWDRSWACGDVPSLIHPKQKYLDNLIELHGSDSAHVEREKTRLSVHRKKAIVCRYAFIGGPRCGSRYLAEQLMENGIGIGHECLGSDGICAWQYVVHDTEYPYIADACASNREFVYPEIQVVYTRDPKSAVASLVVENEQAPLSYAYRRDKILEHAGVDLEAFRTPLERAARTYIHWYELALRNVVAGVVRVERIEEDIADVLGVRDFKEVPLPEEKTGRGQKYLGIRHKPEPIDETEWKGIGVDTRAKLRLVSKQFGYASPV